MPTDTGRRDLGGLILAMVFIGIGGVTIWDTFDYGDPDSYAFLRAIAGALIVSSIALIAWTLIRPPAPQTNPPGSTPRRAGLVFAMLAAAFLMPTLGFVLSGLISFGVILGLAMYDPWTRFRLVIYPMAGTAIVIGFYLLFSRVFLVPLPTGVWLH